MLGRPLFAVPHAPWDDLGVGCSLELLLGARPILRAADVIAALALSSRALSGSPAPSPAKAKKRKGAEREIATLPLNLESKGHTSNSDGVGRTSPPLLLSEGERREEIRTPGVLSSALKMRERDELSGEAPSILSALRDTPLHLDELCDLLGLEPRALAPALLTLTLQAVVVEGPAGFFRRASR
jgi:DNA processing protein